MINIVYSKQFRKSAKPLSNKLRNKLAELIIVLQENPYDSKLHTKRLSGKLTGFLSFRITRDWRVIFQFNDQSTIQLLRIKHRGDAYSNR
jgi:addiction module RelE/StbE family toxin